MSSEARRFTFLQVSDVHLDSSALATGFPLTIEQRKMREQELLDTLLRAFKFAKDKAVDVLLIVGDLWHNDTVRASTIEKVIEGCRALGDIPVLIAPGNRDYYGIESPYNNEFLGLRGLPRRPANVHVFRKEQFTTVKHPKRTDVSFTGRAFTQDEVVSTRLLQNLVPREECEVNILLFHGSIDGYAGNDSDRADKITAPVSTAELKSQNFTYTALGHFHDLTEVRMDSGLLLGAYSGCLAGRSFYETGARYALLGTIEAGRPGRWNVQLEPIELDTRRLIMVATDITGLAPEDMVEEIGLNIEEQGGRPDTDIVFLHLEGRFTPANDPAPVVADIRTAFLELVLYDNTRPDYLAETHEANAIESRYIEALLELKRRIERARKGTESDTMMSGKIVEDALYCGLDALKQKRVTVRNVD